MKRQIFADDFIKMLIEMTPVFDEMIMEDIRPTDGWLLHCSKDYKGGKVRQVFRQPIEIWVLCRESVRKLSEGEHYR